MKSDDSLRRHLVEALDNSHAHLRFDDVIGRWPLKLRGRKARGAPHTAWQLLEHMRIAQWDILDFCRNPNYVSLEFPEGYWPVSATPPSQSAWTRSVRQLRADLQAMKELVANPATDLHARIPHGEGQTILREALLAADHNAYHLGQLYLLRRLLGA